MLSSPAMGNDFFGVDLPELTITPGYEGRPDDDPYHYFPTRPFMQESMERRAARLRRYARVDQDVTDAALEQFLRDLEVGYTLFAYSDFDYRDLYRSAIEVGDCHHAEAIFWDSLIEDRPFLSGFRVDSNFDRVLRNQFLTVHFPELASCLYAADARVLSAFIARHSQQVTGSRTMVRPFLFHASWFSAQNTLHGMRDVNFWRLAEMAANPFQDNYGPAGALLVELALELDSIVLPDDVLHMLLLRAEETWPNDDQPYPSPVSRQKLSDLLALTASRLDEEQLQRAERCYATAEPHTRIFLGDAVYFEGRENPDCLAEQ